jgi:RNA polymerase sigma-70 factor (ECF subfamily)
MTESDLLPVQAARAGDSEAWNALFRHYQVALYSYVFQLVHDEQASLDIVQESFINAAHQITRLRDDAKFGSWLFGIAHQKCIQRWRRSEPAWVPLAEWGDQASEAAFDPGDWLIRKEQEEQFMNGLARLSPPHRSVLLLHFLEDFSLAEIATITGTSPGTVKSRIHYAKKALRESLEDAP